MTSPGIDPNNWDTMQTIVMLAEQTKAPRILYKKMSEKSGSWRIIEPYQFSDGDGGVLLQAWQIDPANPDPAAVCWKTFRIDRIHSIADSGQLYAPRRKAHTSFLKHFDARPDDCQPPDHIRRYRESLLAAVEDGEISDADRETCLDLCERVATKDRKVVHSQVYQQMLFDVLLDGAISEHEDEFLSTARSLLEELGWAP